MTLLGDKILSAFTNASAKIVIFIEINARCFEKLCFDGVLRVLKDACLRVLKMKMLDIEVLSFIQIFSIVVCPLAIKYFILGSIIS